MKVKIGKQVLVRGWSQALRYPVDQLRLRVSSGQQTCKQLGSTWKAVHAVSAGACPHELCRH